MSEGFATEADTLERRCQQATDLHLRDFVDTLMSLRRLGFPKKATIAWMKWARCLSLIECGTPRPEEQGGAVDLVVYLASLWGAPRIETTGVLEPQTLFTPQMERPLLEFLAAHIGPDEGKELFDEHEDILRWHKEVLQAREP